MSEIRIKENESIDSALRRFKRSCAKAGTLSELRKREHYESPSVKRRKSRWLNVCSFLLLCGSLFQHRLSGGHELRQRVRP